MTDKELLELAALAAGYGPVRMADDDSGLLLYGTQELWNSLVDDGDTFGLCADLNLFDNPLFHHYLAIVKMEGGTDKRANARRAFTMVAAELGRVMP